MRRMILIDASWPSNRLAAVTKRTLWVGLVTGGFLTMATSFIGGSRAESGTEEKLTPAPPAAPKWDEAILRLRKRQSDGDRRSGRASADSRRRVARAERSRCPGTPNRRRSGLHFVQ